MEEAPDVLTEGVVNLRIAAARIARWAVLQEAGFFGSEANLKIALGPYPPGTFIAAVRKHYSGIYGSTEGCSAGDIEVMMELLGVMDEIYDVELDRIEVPPPQTRPKRRHGL